jgi:hypothetical protein
MFTNFQREALGMSILCPASLRDQPTPRHAIIYARILCCEIVPVKPGTVERERPRLPWALSRKQHWDWQRRWRSDGRRGHMSHKLHGLTALIQQRVSAEPLDRNRPRQPLSSWSLFCTENSENGRCYPGPTAWSQQSEMPYRVAITFGTCCDQRSIMMGILPKLVICQISG